MILGYAISSEEHAPRDLVANTVMAEEAGFELALISDHFHPWLDRQGESPFVWTTIGGIAARTERLRLAIKEANEAILSKDKASKDIQNAWNKVPARVRGVADLEGLELVGHRIPRFCRSHDKTRRARAPNAREKTLPHGGWGS